MESNPAVSLLGFWMMLQLFATLALLAGGIYLMFCLGRAASGLDRMANAMEDWVALQNQNLPKQDRPMSQVGSTPDLGARGGSVPIPTTTVATPFASAAPQPGYSPPETIISDET